MAAPKITESYIADKLDELPPLPAIVYELSQIINNPMSSTKDVEKVMSKDIGMTTKVLRLANSAYYAIPGGVSSLSRAIAYLGYDTVHQLVLSSSIMEALDVDGADSFDIHKFWRHCVGVGIAAETIAKATNHPLPSDMFTCGLVHDMGKVALFTIAPGLLSQIIEQASTADTSYFSAEKDLDIPGHCEIGNLLAVKWRLPTQIQAVIKFHHEEEPTKRGNISSDLNKAVDIVFLANKIIHALKFGFSGYEKVLPTPKSINSRLALTPPQFKDILKNIKSSLDDAEEFIKAIGG